MKDIFEFRMQIPAIFDRLSYYFLRIECGYPNGAINKPISRIIDSIVIVLKEVENTSDDKNIQLVSNFRKDLFYILDEIRVIDDEMSNWLENKSKIRKKELFTKCKKDVFLGNLDEIVNYGVIIPNWKNEDEYIYFLKKTNILITSMLQKFSNCLSVLILLCENLDNNGALLSREWEMKKRITYFQWIILKGINLAIVDIRKDKIVNINPFEWMNEVKDQRVFNIIDKAESYSDLNKTISLLEHAFVYKPCKTQACTLYYLLGKNYEDLGKWEDAINAFSKMLLVAPPNPVGLYHRAKLYYKNRFLSEAKKDLEIALSLPEYHLYLLTEEEKREAMKLIHEIEVLLKE